MEKYLKNKKILITAGPTREYIDPVRYISNDSSGKMGYALARAAKNMGGNITLISGPTSLKEPEGTKIIFVSSAREMYKAVIKEFEDMDIIICSAAVSDFRPIKMHNRKIKKTVKPNVLNIHLVQNPDILKTLGKRKTKKQKLIGFALETENITENAMKKLRDKNCDYIIANDTDNINADKASVTILDKRGNEKLFRQQGKKRLASNILKSIFKK